MIIMLKIMQNLLNLPAGYATFLWKFFDEHNGVRSDARVFDVGHMGQLKVSGIAALKFLNYMLTNDYVIAGLALLNILYFAMKRVE